MGECDCAEEKLSLTGPECLTSGIGSNLSEPGLGLTTLTDSSDIEDIFFQVLKLCVYDWWLCDTTST